MLGIRNTQATDSGINTHLTIHLVMLLLNTFAAIQVFCHASKNFACSRLMYSQNEDAFGRSVVLEALAGRG
jgi:hypothetical protein